jgi:putative Mg2+ transporter-C (MgtC) family protein
MELPQTDVIKILLSLLIGSMIGAEREFRNKSAGFRTIILITLGSTLFTILSYHVGAGIAPERIASNIVVGIGFLGAGVIFKTENRVNGLTTASTIWIAAALGMGIGSGYYAISFIVTALVLFVLYGFVLMEKYIDSIHQSRNYKIVCHYRQETLNHYEELFKEHHLKFQRIQQSKKDDLISGSWSIRGSARSHQKLVNVLLKDERITEFYF